LPPNLEWTRAILVIGGLCGVLNGHGMFNFIRRM